MRHPYVRFRRILLLEPLERLGEELALTAMLESSEVTATVGSQGALIERRAMKNYGLKGVVPVLVSLVSIAVCTAVAQAQSSTGSKADLSEAVAKLEKVSAQLQLTPEQKEQIKPILMEEAPKMKALKSNTTMPPLQKARQMREIADETDAKLKPILSPQQYAKWEQIRGEERQQMIQKMRENSESQ
jgi:hypothetical protein